MGDKSRHEGQKNERKQREGIGEKRSESLWERQHRGQQEERDVVCVTQFCVLMEDCIAISPAAFAQHHHRD